MARERVVIFPEIFVNGKWQFVLPMDHIRTKADESHALDLIEEMKIREGKDFFKVGRHRKLKNRSISFSKSSQDESDDNS